MHAAAPGAAEAEASEMSAGAAAGALNVLRFLQDLPEMRKGSVLERELSEGQFNTVSMPTLVHGAAQA